MTRAIRACAAPCLFIIAACGGVPAPELPVVTVETRPAASPPPVAPAAAPPEPAETVALDEVACTWKTAVMRTREEPARLCAEGGAPCFFESVSGHFGERDMELRIGRGAAPGALVSIPYEGMTVRGFVPAGSGAIVFSVVARRKPLGGFYLPDNVRVLEGRVGEVVATADLPPGVRSAAALRESLACADIHPESAWISLEDMKALVGAKDPETFVQLRAGSIALSSAPSGPVVATLDADGSETVYAFQTSGKARFILYPSVGGHIFGWVPSSATGPSPGMGTAHGFSGAGRGSWVGIPDPERGARCPHTVSLLARVGTRMFAVGTIAPGTPILTAPSTRKEGLVGVRLRHPLLQRGDEPTIRQYNESIRTTPDTELFVRSADVQGCSR